mmetsp:Transcript_7128/g.10619  ORF Transcript_7128/g.10619 Transcript_7128/m.10619 type:complete len:149 (+) Transcript_7128:36-482(+)
MSILPSLILSIIFIHITPSALSSDSDCLSQGFNRDVLQCNTCERLLKVTDDNDLFEECQKCCSITGNDMFQLAVLEVDRKMLHHYENIMTIAKSANELNLMLRHKYMARPTLLMYSERTDDEPAEVISVASWTADVMQEYLRTHVVSD